MPDEEVRSTPTLLPPRSDSPPQTVGELLRREEATTRRLSAVATRYLSAERAAHLAISAVRKTPLLAKCSPASFMGSLMGATGLGLEPNTLKDHCYLIPYKRSEMRRDQNRNIIRNDHGAPIWDEFYECQLQIGYRGFITLLYRSPIVTSVDAEAIYDVDHFIHRKGSNSILEFEKSLDRPRIRYSSDSDEADFSDGLRGAFCFVRLRDDATFFVAPLEELYRARSRSQAWTSAKAELDAARVAVEEAKSKSAGVQSAAARRLARAQKNFAETPWRAYEDTMAAKTAIRRLAKQADLDTDTDGAMIGLAADLDALGDAGTIDMEALSDPDHAKGVLQGKEDLRRAEAVDDDGGPPSEQAGDRSAFDQESDSAASGDTGTQKGGPPPEQAGKPEPDKRKPAPQKDMF